MLCRHRPARRIGSGWTCRWLCLSAICLALSWVSAGPALAQDVDPLPQPVPQPPEMAQGDRLGAIPGVNSPAINADVTSILGNPAAIGRAYPFGMYFGWDRSTSRDEERSDLGTVALSAGGLGLAYQRGFFAGSERLTRWTFAGGGGRGPLTAGLRGTRESYRRSSFSASAWRWDAGLLWRPVRFASLGAVAQDLNQDRLIAGGPVYDRSYTVGLGVRPLGLAYSSRLTIFGDVTGRESEVWKDDAWLQTGLSVEPLAGLELSGAMRGRLGDFAGSRELRVGASLHARHASVLTGYRYDDNERYARSIHALTVTAARQRTLVPSPRLIRMDLHGNYADAGQSGIPIPIPLVGSPSSRSIRPVLRRLEDAARDPDVRGVVLRIDNSRMAALSDEVRDAIGRVRAAGKPVVAYLDPTDGIGGYYIAAACNQVVMDSVSEISGLGVRNDVKYFAEMLDSAGVQFEKIEHGKYKSAGEQLVRTSASEGFREQTNSMIDAQRDAILGNISRDRNIERARLEEMADGRLVEGPEALRLGLVDSLGDFRSAERILARLAGEDRKEPRPARDVEDRRYLWADPPKIAVLWVDGTINDGESSGGFFSENTMGSETVVKQLRDLGGRSDVKAIVLRIDSPGGSGFASDLIWRAVEEVQAKGKKVVASMSRLAASGGYYIACGADEIWADPMTLTGSIGVLMLKPNFAGFYDKHGINVETFERGRYMGIYSTAEPLSAEERAHLVEKIDLFYQHFLRRVAKDRPLTVEQIDAVGQGRVWTGRQALEHKLIDRLGGLHEAVARARELAGLPEQSKVINIERPGGGFLSFLSKDVRAASTFRPTLPWLGLGTDLSPLDAWMLRQQLRGMERPGSMAGWRAENPVVEALVEGF